MNGETSRKSGETGFPDSVDLFNRWRGGSDSAADRIVDRYFSRLVALVARRISDDLGARFDPEDVVQSAYLSFFIGAADGKYSVRRGGDLWRLLAAIAVNKLRRAVRRHVAEKRSVHRELPLSPQLLFPPADPGPFEDATAMDEEVESLFLKLSPIERRMLQMRLQGYTLDEIAESVGRCQRTVRRSMEGVKRMLADRLTEVES